MSSSGKRHFVFIVALLVSGKIGLLTYSALRLVHPSVELEWHGMDGWVSATAAGKTKVERGKEGAIDREISGPMDRGGRGREGSGESAK